MKKFVLLPFVILISSCFNPELSTTENSTSEFAATTLKLNSGNEIFKNPTSSTDCGYYLSSTSVSQRATSFLVGNKIYFSVPCKTSDSGTGGWHYGMMSWSTGDLSTSWIDGDVGTGEQALFDRSEVDSNGHQLRNWIEMQVTYNGTDYRGLIYKYYSSSEYGGSSGFYTSPVAFSDPNSFSPSDIDVNNRGVIEYNFNDNTWKGKTSRTMDIEYKNSNYLVYFTTTNSPTEDTYYIVLRQSADLINFDDPTTFLLEGYRDPNVFEYKGSVYMIAFETASNSWKLIPGESYTSFDVSKAVTVEIGSKIYGKGGWDDTPLYTAYPNHEPRLAGVEVVFDKVYLFYLAGGFNQLPTDPNSTGSYNGVPYDGPRGMGVMEITIQE
ncbi:MAG: hypothetical protein AB8E15_06565 [Bdellovibrionales bacterium]